MKLFNSLSELEYFKPLPGLKAKVMHTESQTFAFWEIEQGTVLPAHQHPHEQVSIVTSGQLELTIDDEMQVVSKGMFVFIPPNTIHSAKAVSHVELTDVFTPIREDFKTYKI